MKTLYESITQSHFTRREIDESIMDDDAAVVYNTTINTSISLILSGKATKKDLNALKDQVAIWKPKNSIELSKIVRYCTDIYSKCSLNWIDVSDITDMNGMFLNSKFNGDISKWNVSNAKHIRYMFYDSKFNGDISKWDISNVKDMRFMFQYSKFNGDISKWNVSNVEMMNGMFENSAFNKDISNWNINDNCDVRNMFDNCYIKKEYKPKALQ